VLRKATPTECTPFHRHKQGQWAIAHVGPGILEIVSDHRGDTYRGIYTVRFADKVYVLHLFQKKSKTRVRTPKSEIALVRQRLRPAVALHEGEN
jgi:phage-related protein